MSPHNNDTIISFKINKKTRDDATNLFNHLGLSMSSALKMFIHQCLIEHGIPFQMKDRYYDPVTQTRVNNDIANFTKNKKIDKHHLIN